MELTQHITDSLLSRKLLLVTICIALAATVSRAQPLVVTGTISTTSGESLAFASVLLLTPGDSTIVASAASDVDGVFFITDSAPQDQYIVQASFVGYRVFYKQILNGGSSDTLQVGRIELASRSVHLKEITITERRDPIVIKNDTIEYRAESFPTLAYADTESLLKKIPGLDVERDGSIQAAGEPVKRIFINGREVFGNDLQLITRNLPAEAIDNVQIFDYKTDAEQFSSSSSFTAAKAINIQLKKDYQKMRFGNASAAMGTDERYAGEGRYSSFRNGNQLLASGKSNNINNIDVDNFGTNGTSPESRQGLLTSHSGAVNTIYNLSDAVSVNGSFHTGLGQDLTKVNVQRQTFLPEGIADLSERNEQSTRTLGQQAVAGIQVKDTFNTLRLTLSANFSDVSTSGTTHREAQSPDGTNGYTGERIFAIDNMNLSGNALFFYGHRFRKEGRTITADAQLSLYQNRLENENNNMTIFNDGLVVDDHQLNEQHNENDSYRASFSYTEPLGRRHRVYLKYGLAQRASDFRQSVNRFSGETKLFAEAIRDDLHSGVHYQRAGIAYKFQGNRLTLSAGSEIQQTQLSRKSFDENPRFKQTFENLLPYAVVSFNLSDYTKLNLGYNTFVREPSVSQLQPVESNTDPLNVYYANLALRPEYAHEGRINIRSSLRKIRGLFISGTGRIAYIRNPITQAITIDEMQRRSIQYINTASSENRSGDIHVHIPLKKVNSRLKATASANYQTNINVINGVTTNQTRSGYGAVVTYTYNYKTAVDLSGEAHYQISSSDDGLSPEPQFFTRTGYLADLGLLLKQRVHLRGVFSYNRLQNDAINFDQSFPMLNISLGLRLFKEKGLMTFSGHNLLEQSQNGTQAANLNYIEQRLYETILGRFFMVGFTYHIGGRQVQ